MKSHDIFKDAVRHNGLDSRHDSFFVATVGMDASPAEVASEAKFNSRERGEMVKRVLGHEAMIVAGLNASPVKINAEPVSMMMHPTPIGEIKTVPAPEAVLPTVTPEHDLQPQLMLPEVASPDGPKTLVSA